MKQEKEIKVVGLMIEKYCHGNHGTKKHEICGECSQLFDYVKLRRSKCPHGDSKPFCSNCRIHCYKPDMREKIRAVMRYSGPRIVLNHPILATSHLIQTKRQKRRMEKEDRAREAAKAAGESAPKEAGKPGKERKAE